jgi:hypothetical protein
VDFASFWENEFRFDIECDELRQTMTKFQGFR